MLLIQQGDVLIRSATIPAGAKQRQGRPVLAEGEHTGHAHVAEGVDVEIYEKDETLYVSAPHGATVRHEEHKPVELPPGNYKIARVKEYDHFAEEGRSVMD